MLTRAENPSTSVQNRHDQIGVLAEVYFDRLPVLVHGSLAHAAIRGATLPSETKLSGAPRDIDVFTQGLSGKNAVEEATTRTHAHAPSPIDAGLCDLMTGDSNCRIVQKDGVEVELKDQYGVLEEVAHYEVKGSDGLMLRSFSPAGLLAVHLLEPSRRWDPVHRIADEQFEYWCRTNGVSLPDDLSCSITEFHRAYKAKYPYGNLLKHASSVYVHVIPEKLRSRLRSKTHAFMKQHAGRVPEL